MEDRKLQGDVTADKWTKCRMFFLVVMKKKMEMNSHIFSSSPKTKASPLI